MKKKIFYWSPCLNPVGTVISTINSAIAMASYQNKYEVCIINACGEWTEFRERFDNNSIGLINLSFNYFKFLPKTGYFGSRLSYLLIYFISFYYLLKLIKKEKPDILIAHLITSLPLTLLNFFNLKTKIILRISGYPKLNLLRKFFWKKTSSKITFITCPTKSLLNDLANQNIFSNDKLLYLPDAIVDLKKLAENKNNKSLIHIEKHKKIILATGRLTRQKNFNFLIKEFGKFIKDRDDYLLYIIGEGEERKNLEKTIQDNNLNKKAFLLGYKQNVFSYMRKSEIFVLSSLWEEVGFVIVEAALNNLYVISSDCPNGPREFLNDGKNGILFQNNVKDAIYKSLVKFETLNNEKKFRDKIMLKKNTKIYSKFNHYRILKKIIF